MSSNQQVLLGLASGTAPIYYIAISHSTTPFVSAYPWSASGFGAKYTAPTTPPPGVVNALSFSPSGTEIVTAGGTSPYVASYQWSSGFGTKLSDPGTTPTGIGTGVSFSSLI